MAVVKAERTITSLRDWEIHAGPKSANQWVDGRSAKEVARAWLAGGGNRLPEEVENALKGNKNYGPTQSWIAEPEAKLRFDGFAGEPRNSDLAVHVKDKAGDYILAVEAKADESFGDTIKKATQAAIARLKANPRSNGLKRIHQLKAAILGRNPDDEEADSIIRYQLLTACAGALCEAERKNYSRALVLIHEFITDRTEDRKHKINAEDLNEFAREISHNEISMIEPGIIYGPIHVPGHPILKSKIDLYIGKVFRNIRSNVD